MEGMKNKRKPDRLNGMIFFANPVLFKHLLIKQLCYFYYNIFSYL